MLAYVTLCTADSRESANYIDTHIIRNWILNLDGLALRQYDAHKKAPIPLVFLLQVYREGRTGAGASVGCIGVLRSSLPPEVSLKQLKPGRLC